MSTTALYSTIRVIISSNSLLILFLPGSLDYRALLSASNLQKTIVILHSTYYQTVVAGKISKINSRRKTKRRLTFVFLVPVVLIKQDGFELLYKIVSILSLNV